MKNRISFLVSFILLTTSNLLNAQIVGLTIGALINQLMNRVDNSIRQAESAGQGLVIQAGSTLHLSLENAKIAYAESLDKTFDRVDQTTQGVFNQLQSLTTQMESQVASDANEIISKAQTITNTLPFSTKLPQVSHFTPSYLAPSNQPYPVTIEIKGNFIYSSNGGYTPQLNVNGKLFNPIQNTTQTLKFTVPVNTLAPNFDNTFNYTTAELIVPYESGLAFTKRKEAKYQIVFGVLPNSPGRIRIKHKIQRIVHEEQTKSTQGWKQYSSNDDITHTYCSEGFPGWNIKNANFIREWSQGNENDQWSKRLISSNPKVCYEVVTVHHRVGTSGKVDFHFDFTLYRDKPVEEWVEENINLNWGESRTFDYRPGTWAVIIDSFDGKHNEYINPMIGNYLDITANNSLQIQAKKAGQIIYP